MISQPGIYPDFPEADYYNDPAPQPSLTQSIVKVLIAQSALHARMEHPRLAPPEPDDEDAEPEKYVKAQAIGNAAHLTLIGRGKTLAIGEFKDWKSKEARAFKEEAQAAGKTVILQKHMTVAHQMVLAARLQLSDIAAVEPAMDLAFREGHGEVMIAAKTGGIWLRSLVDWMVSPTLLFDYKSTGLSVEPHAVPNLMANAGWPIQAATQERILDLIDPDNAGRRRFFFVAQENYPPFALTAHEMPEGTMTMGRKMLAAGEAMWREAMATGKWRGYEPVVHQPHYPGYVENRWLEREIEHADRQSVTTQPKIDPETLMAG